MIVEDINSLDGWRKSSKEEHDYILQNLLPLYKKGMTSNIFWGMAMAAVAILLIIGIVVQTSDRTFGLASVIFFGIIALLALGCAISLFARSIMAQKRLDCITGGKYQVLECMCVDTDHHVESPSISLIRIRSMSGRECARWLRASKSIACAFDALSLKTGEKVPEFYLFVVCLDCAQEYHVVQKMK